MVLQVFAVALLAMDLGGSGWKEASKGDGVYVFERERPGHNVHELKAVGMINAPPPQVWKVISDYDHYREHMPYTETSKVLSKEDNGKITYFYTVINAPLVTRRDYVLRIVDESDWKGGQGVFKATWVAVDDPRMPPSENLVRVQLNEGAWVLESRDHGKKTFATYYVFTDPGGKIPGFVARQANHTALPEVFRTLRKDVGASPR